MKKMTVMKKMTTNFFVRHEKNVPPTFLSTMKKVTPQLF